MSITKTEERIPARMTKEVYERIVEAAGTVLNQFIVQSALEKADNIIERERIIRLSASGAKVLFALIENPPKPSPSLKKTMRLRGKLRCSE